MSVEEAFSIERGLPGGLYPDEDHRFQLATTLLI
jgi:hypothetical protein